MKQWTRHQKKRQNYTQPQMLEYPAVKQKDSYESKQQGNGKPNGTTKRRAIRIITVLNYDIYFHMHLLFFILEFY